MSDAIWGREGGGRTRRTSKSQLTEQEKVSRWDDLMRTLSKPGVRNTYVRHLSAVRRAVILLLAEREELPPALVAELKSHKITLDGLHLEAIDGFADTEGVLNLLPILARAPGQATFTSTGKRETEGRAPAKRFGGE